MYCCVCCYVIFIFFFFKQKTAYEMRISDWSSDVCSSDLKLVDMLKDGLSVISLAAYWKSTPQPADDEDEYEEPTAPIPSICLCSFTGRAAQQVKSNFPTDWHSNIMTIHRMLGFYPEFYDAVDPDSGEMRQTMRFVPSYNKENLLPWDIIVVDEAGMCGLDLWHLIWAACKPTRQE